MIKGCLKSTQKIPKVGIPENLFFKGYSYLKGDFLICKVNFRDPPKTPLKMDISKEMFTPR